MEKAFFDIPLYREFAQFQEFSRLPDESTILRFRHRLEKHKLAGQILAVGQRPTSMTWSKATPCCMAMKTMLSVMRATGAS